MKQEIWYYFWASFRRKIIDSLHETYKHYYRGTVLDVGGRDRGKFVKPKHAVKKWIFADIEKKHHPDLVMDIANMSSIANNSITVISAIEVFAHVKYLEKALDECYRVLEPGGYIIFSVPMLYPIINDPTDFQRWTESKWRYELGSRGFSIEHLEQMGHFFTVVADFFNMANKSQCRFLRHVGLFFYPLLSLIAKLDAFKCVKRNKTLHSFTTGYFIIAKK